MTTKQRDFSIDILKCLAVLLITWSHFESQLGKYAVLATGGSFGDCLFFFCSGYTLLLTQRKENFFNWYKRRINRIYPTVFTWALLCSFFFHDTKNMGEIIISGGGFFVSCIMVFYVIFYIVKKYTSNYVAVCTGTFVICYTAFILIDKNNSILMFNWRLSMYFLPMLMGATLGKRITNERFTFRLPIWSRCISLFLSIAAYYLLMNISQPNTSLEYLYPVVILPQLGVTFFLFSLCKTAYLERIYKKKYIRFFIRFIGALCLEVYIVQPILIREFTLPELFPINILIVFLIIIGLAYLLKCISRIWEQTFKEANYDWVYIIKPW